MVRKFGVTLIEIIIVIAILVVLFAVGVMFLDPVGQFAKARNTQRELHINSILTAIRQNIADNRLGKFSCAQAGDIPTSTIRMAAGAGNYDIAPCLVPSYIQTMPYDPSDSLAHYSGITDYDTGYDIEARVLSLGVKTDSDARQTIESAESQAITNGAGNGTPHQTLGSGFSAGSYTLRFKLNFSVLGSHQIILEFVDITTGGTLLTEFLPNATSAGVTAFEAPVTLGAGIENDTLGFRVIINGGGSSLTVPGAPEANDAYQYGTHTRNDFSPGGTDDSNISDMWFIFSTTPDVEPPGSSYTEITVSAPGAELGKVIEVTR